MGVVLTIVLGICAIISVPSVLYLCLVIFPKYWTGKWRESEVRLQMVPGRYAADAWVALNRTGSALVIAAVGLGATAVGLFVTTLKVESLDWNSFRDGIPMWVYITFAGSIIASWVLRYSILRWNRPGFLVPPHHRQESGVSKVYARRIHR